MEIEMGSVYKLDHHSNTQIPAALTSIRAVFVNDKSDEEVTVVFPSVQSLENFFDHSKKNGFMQPNLDQHFVMGSNLSNKLLTQKISFEEFASKRGNRSFWVFDDDDDEEEESKCGLAVNWGKRRRTVCQKKLDLFTPKLGASMDENKEEDEEKESEEEEKKVLEYSRSLRKRKCQLKSVTYCEKKKKGVVSEKKKKMKFKDAQHRWTLERYKLAEKNMLNILKEKGARPGNPILRPDLRSEARKLIGDTGLLDHLLKHMAGKLAPGGKERFRRRHNPEGAMEYWLESADLIEARKKAGVTDPYWVPPPGWKPGDCPNQDPVCAMQLKEIKDEINEIKREMEVLSCRGKENSRPTNVDPSSFEDSVKLLKASHAELMKKKAQIEQQLLEISKHFSGMEEDIGRLKKSVATEKGGESRLMAEGNAEADKGKNRAVISEDKSLENKENEQIMLKPQKLKALSPKTSPTSAAENKKNRKEILKSGFRICKPQGTFVWPSQMGSSSSSTASSQMLQVNLEDLVGYPTPPSVSSSSSKTPSYMFPPPPPPPILHLQQQKPLSALVSRPVATRAALTLNFSVASIRGSSTIESITSPTTTPTATATATATGCSCCVQTFVPDLNEAPLSSFT